MYEPEPIRNNSKKETDLSIIVKMPHSDMDTSTSHPIL